MLLVISSYYGSLLYIVNVSQKPYLTWRLKVHGFGDRAVRNHHSIEKILSSFFLPLNNSDPYITYCSTLALYSTTVG
jgi:hypothetical protein